MTVYLQVPQSDDTYTTKLVASQSRVAPLSQPSVPRLELLASLITSRLLNTVKNAFQNVLNIERTVCWTGSKCASFWIMGGREHKQFIQNRVDEVLDLTNPNEWNHCPGEENPAGIATRGLFPTSLVENKLWWEGPPWLKLSDKHWPSSEIKLESPPEECWKEVKVKHLPPEMSESVLLKKCDIPVGISNRFSVIPLAATLN